MDVLSNRPWYLPVSRSWTPKRPPWRVTYPSKGHQKEGLLVSCYFATLSPKSTHLSVIYHSNGPQKEPSLVHPCLLFLDPKRAPWSGLPLEWRSNRTVPGTFLPFPLPGKPALLTCYPLLVSSLGVSFHKTGCYLVPSRGTPSMVH